MMPRQQASMPPLDSVAQLVAQCKDEPLAYDGIVPELCVDLAPIILHGMQTRKRSTPSKNVGGWKSDEDFFRWPDPTVHALRDAIAGLIGAYPTKSWAMVNANGSHHPRHQHTIARLVGVYYVDAGDPITPTIFECKKHREIAVEPHPGRVVLSPGAMWHHVPPYPGTTPRISVAFEIRR